MISDPLSLYEKVAEKSPSGGGLSIPTRSVWSSLLNFQSSDLQISGQGMEIGVWYGFGSGFILNHLKPDERLLMIDKFMGWDQFGETLTHFASDAQDRVDVMKVDSKDLSSSQVSDAYIGACRFLHIDGEHSYDAVMNDMAITENLLSPKGVIVVDDVLNALCPQVTQALFEYLAKSEELELILFGFNKAYVVRRSALRDYQKWVRSNFIETDTPLLDVAVSFGSRTGAPAYCSILPRGAGKRFIFVNTSFDTPEDLPLDEFFGPDT